MYFFVCILKVHIVLLFHGYYGGHMSNLRKYRESLNISQTTLAIQTVCLLVAVTIWRSGTVGITSTGRNLAITGANNADSATSAYERCRQRLSKRRLYRLSASEYVGNPQRNPEQQRIVGLDSRLTTAENDIDYLANEVVAIQNTLSDHETRIDALEYATSHIAKLLIALFATCLIVTYFCASNQQKRDN